MDVEFILIVPLIRNAVVAEGHIADGQVEEIVRVVRILEAFDLDIRILIELPGDAAGDGVKLHAVTLAVRHIVRQQAEEIPDAAGWLQNIAPLEAQVLYGLVYGLNDNGGGIVGVQRGCPGGFVLRFGQCRL